VAFLDTDVMVDILRGYPPAITWMSSLGEEEILLPGFVVMELIQGCRNRVQQRRLQRALAGYQILWPAPATCDAALSVFAQQHLSHGLGVIDALIGQMAVDAGTPLHTFNQRHYAAIPRLATVQPYVKPAG
jgi:predicted nucleic acid-binding protein